MPALDPNQRNDVYIGGQNPHLRQLLELQRFQRELGHILQSDILYQIEDLGPDADVDPNVVEGEAYDPEWRERDIREIRERLPYIATQDINGAFHAALSPEELLCILGWEINHPPFPMRQIGLDVINRITLN
jgi:hypothetical protein